MKVLLDIEANGLENPTEIWVIVCKDIDTGKSYVFRNVTSDAEQKKAAKDLLASAECVVGHNIVDYDLPVLRNHNIIDREDFTRWPRCQDTFIISKLMAYSRPGGHSIESYGKEFNIEKVKSVDFSKYSKELEERCVRDVGITQHVYRKFLGYINDLGWQPALDLEHQFQGVCNSLHANGFAFNTPRAKTLLEKVTKELVELDEKILKAFPPKEVLIKEFTPKATKHGTISRTSVPRSLHSNIHEYEIGRTYQHTRLEPFNPGSHKQIISVLSGAGWQPTDKTKSHVETEREIQRLRYSRDKIDPELKSSLEDKLDKLKISGWKINENNLLSLPDEAPKPAGLLAKRILLESRRKTLTEWLDLVQDDGRIHGRFQGIGAWTHRMAHQKPNTANIPNEFDNNGKKKLLGKELRSLWQAGTNIPGNAGKRLLVGVDAEGIQLRIFAHLINDKEFTDALVRGKKSDKTDPHSLNQRILGDACRGRQVAKRFIYALLLGAGIGKLAQILEISEDETRRALERLMARYQGFAALKETLIPADARRGWFRGLDGRLVPIPGATPGERKHLCMSGYLQNGEAIIMKKACLKWEHKLKNYKALLVDFVHDEWQTECPNDLTLALKIAKMQADSLQEVGEELKLKCPLAGSYWNDDHKDYTINTNWSLTH